MLRPLRQHEFQISVALRPREVYLTIPALAIEPAGDRESFGTHIKIARTISDVIRHPGKTLYGSTNGIELLDKDGKPL